MVQHRIVPAEWEFLGLLGMAAELDVILDALVTGKRWLIRRETMHDRRMITDTMVSLVEE